MKPSDFVPDLKRWRFLCLTAALAFLTSGTLVVALRVVDTKWLVCGIGGMAILGMAMASGRFDRLLLAAIFFLIPINVDWNLHFAESVDTVYLSSGMPRLGISAIDLLLFCLYFSWILKMILNPFGQRMIWAPTGTLILLFIIWCCLSMINAHSRLVSSWLIFGFLKAFFFYFYMINHVRRREDLILFAQCVVLGMLLESGIALLQQLKGGNLGLHLLGERKVMKEMEMTGSTIFRVGGTLGHPNHLGGYLNSALPLILAFVLAPVQKMGKLTATGALLLGCLVLLLTYSRSAWLMGAIGIMYLIFKVGLDAGKKISKGMLFGSVILLTVLTAAFAPMIAARMTEDDKGSTSSRIPQIKVAISMIKTHPILGVGVNNYTLNTHLHETYVEHNDSMTRVSLHHGQIHNIFFNYAAETGLVGVTLLTLIMFSVIRAGMKKYKAETDPVVKILLLGILVGFITRIPHDAFHTTNLPAHIFFWLYAACLTGPRIITRHGTTS